MTCLENYTIEQVKEMSPSELKVLWNVIVEEKQAMDIRATVIDMLEIMEAKKPLIEE
ncbi:MAG: hypothetical protein JRJ62_15630 [Deltaproteobacteria bacterium]|nr:hypothetical protein [Deltaproteobacteria bacterium]